MLEVRLAKRQLTIVIDGQATAPDQPQIADAYTYGSEPRPPADQFSMSGTLGADFMLANQAVIDFGIGTLLLAPR